MKTFHVVHEDSGTSERIEAATPEEAAEAAFDGHWTGDHPTSMTFLVIERREPAVRIEISTEVFKMARRVG